VGKVNRATLAQDTQQIGPSEVSRRTEILKTAARLFASSGFRVSLQEIANECGILAGSLYHHFDSKEKILQELVLQYQAELDDVARNSLRRLKRDGEKSHLERIIGLAEAIVACAKGHRAALIQTFMELPVRAGESSAKPVNPAHDAIVRAMFELLQEARADDYLRRDVDLSKLAEQICRSMLNFAVGTFHLSPGAHQVPRIKCRMLMEGLFLKTPSNAQLERSSAFRAAEAMIAQLTSIEADARMAVLREAARKEFGRLGFEGATIRDVAAASGMSTGAIYRMVGSKDELLKRVMQPFAKAVTNSWDALMSSDSTPIEKLDAILWAGVNLLDRFSDEFVIQLAWLRENPPPVWSEARAFSARLSYLRRLLAEAEQRGEIRSFDAPTKIQALCLMELVWVPPSIVRAAGLRGALAQARETLLRGAVLR
jgi:AcrR family transcriptional regulator